MSLDIGTLGVNKDKDFTTGRTYINKTNPCNGAGYIETVHIWAANSLTDFYAGIFYVVSGNKLKCRSAVSLGNITGGAERYYTVNLAVQPGDYIGGYCSAGSQRGGTSGSGGLWSLSGNKCVVDNDSTYSLADDDDIGIYATGVTLELPPFTNTIPAVLALLMN